jgi:hypothetical protein
MLVQKRFSGIEAIASSLNAYRLDSLRYLGINLRAARFSLWPARACGNLPWPFYSPLRSCPASQKPVQVHSFCQRHSWGPWSTQRQRSRCTRMHPRATSECAVVSGIFWAHGDPDGEQWGTHPEHIWPLSGSLRWAPWALLVSSSVMPQASFVGHYEVRAL